MFKESRGMSTATSSSTVLEKFPRDLMNTNTALLNKAHNFEEFRRA